MPPEVARWKPERQSPLAPPTRRFCELEAAKAFGYRLWEWDAEDPMRKAEMVAHEQIKALRENYLAEHDAKKADAPKGPTGLEAMRRRMGLVR